MKCIKVLLKVAQKGKEKPVNPAEISSQIACADINRRQTLHARTQRVSVGAARRDVKC